MVTIDLSGNIQMQLEKHEPLFDLIYSCSSDEISQTLQNVAGRLKIQMEKNQKGKVNDEFMLLNDNDYSMIANLSYAFKTMKETPIVILIKE